MIRRRRLGACDRCPGDLKVSGYLDTCSDEAQLVVTTIRSESPLVSGTWTRKRCPSRLTAYSLRNGLGGSGIVNNRTGAPSVAAFDMSIGTATRSPCGSM